MKAALKNHKIADYFNRYIDLVEDIDIISGLEKNLSETKALFDLLIESQGDYQYAEGKWTIKELLIHIIDAERIFGYRALCISRNDKTDLPGFNHDDFVKYADANNRTLCDISKEFEAVRQASISLFKNFTPEALNRAGKANGKEMTVLALAYLTIGHAIHHTNVLREKYLNHE
ncbi:MAG: DinB family protein [Vicingus serpentipes]|nr:DinB family protein [Vicingus serpentipes]